MKVISIQLINGAEIIGKFDENESNDVAICVVDPIRLIETQDARGNTGLAFAPWSFSVSESSVSFFMQAMVRYPMVVSPQVEQQYIQVTTGIVVPEQGKILHG